MKLRISVIAGWIAAGLLVLCASADLQGGAKDKKAELVVDDELLNADLKDTVFTQSFSKAYTFKMEKGKAYVIHATSRVLRTALRLEDADGAVLGDDQDRGDMRGAIVFHRAAKTEDHQIIVTTPNDGAMGKFTLSVKEAPIAKPIELKNDKGQATYAGSLIKIDERHNARRFSKTFLFPMEAGKTYQLDHKSARFDAYLILEDPDGKVLAEDDDSGGGLNSRIVHKAAKTGKYRIIATSLDGVGTGAFTVSVRQTNPPLARNDKKPADGKPIELKNDKGQATYQTDLTQDDPLYKGKKHKLFLFNLEEGKTYQIDMTSTAFDSYLFLEGPNGNLLAQDDDSGGNLNARITIKATATGKHRIVATYFQQATGEFTLTIRQTDPAPGDLKKK